MEDYKYINVKLKLNFLKVKAVEYLLIIFNRGNHMKALLDESYFA